MFVCLQNVELIYSCFTNRAQPGGLSFLRSQFSSLGGASSSLPRGSCGDGESEMTSSFTRTVSGASSSVRLFHLTDMRFLTARSWGSWTLYVVDWISEVVTESRGAEGRVARRPEALGSEPAQRPLRQLLQAGSEPRAHPGSSGGDCKVWTLARVACWGQQGTSTFPKFPERGKKDDFSVLFVLSNLTGLFILL